VSALGCHKNYLWDSGKRTGYDITDEHHQS
jgi:hypothetical protein